MARTRRSMAAEIRTRMSEGGKTAQQVVEEHPELAGGLDRVVSDDATTRSSRGSGPSSTGPLMRSTGVSLDPPRF